MLVLAYASNEVYIFVILVCVCVCVFIVCVLSLFFQHACMCLNIYKIVCLLIYRLVCVLYTPLRVFSEIFENIIIIVIVALMQLPELYFHWPIMFNLPKKKAGLKVFLIEINFNGKIKLDCLKITFKIETEAKCLDANIKETLLYCCLLHCINYFEALLLLIVLTYRNVHT